jgi:hypothetical protein
MVPRVIGAFWIGLAAGPMFALGRLPRFLAARPMFALGVLPRFLAARPMFALGMLPWFLVARPFFALGVFPRFLAARPFFAFGLLPQFLAARLRLARMIATGATVASRVRIVVVLFAIGLAVVAIGRLLVPIRRSGMGGPLAVGAVAVAIVGFFVTSRLALARAAAGLLACRRVAVVGLGARLVVDFTGGFDDGVDPLADGHARLARGFAGSLTGFRAEEAFDVPRTARFHARAQKLHREELDMPCLEPALVNRRCRRAQSWVLGTDFFRIRVKKWLIRRRNPHGVAVLQHPGAPAISLSTTIAGNCYGYPYRLMQSEFVG